METSTVSLEKSDENGDFDVGPHCRRHPGVEVPRFYVMLVARYKQVFSAPKTPQLWVHLFSDLPPGVVRDLRSFRFRVIFFLVSQLASTSEPAHAADQ